jgi:AhpD family alkylhydroperoxidase
MTQRMDYEHVIPEAMKALGGVYLYVARSGFPRMLINLIYLRISLLNGCAYCIDMHTRDLMKDGASDAKVALVPVWREAGAHFSDREKAALAWAESLTLISQTRAPDSDYQLVAAHFGEKEIGDLTVAIGLMNVYNRIATGFRRGPAEP